MFVAANFFEALAAVVSYLIQIMWWLIVIRALLSWVSPDPFNPIVRFIETTTEPLLAPIRGLIPAWRIGLDLSPMIALLFLYFMKIFLVQTLYGIAARIH